MKTDFLKSIGIEDQDVINKIMAKKRQSFSKDFKAKVTLETLREESTIQEIAVKYGVHPNQISQWESAATLRLP